MTFKHRSTGTAIFLGICWLYACIHLDRQILGILAESVKSDLHLKDQQLGVLTGSAFSIVYALLGLFFGGLADRSDRLALVRTGAWVWSLSCIAAAFAPGFALLVAARAGVAVGEAVATAAAVSLIAEFAGVKYRARAASLFLTSAFIGAGSAAIAGGAVVDLFRTSTAIVGWRAALLLAGAPGILGALYLGFFRAQKPPRQLSAAQPGSSGTAAVLMIAAVGAVGAQMHWPPILSVPLCVLVTLAIGAWWANRLRLADHPAYLATLGSKSFRYVVIAFTAVMFVDYAAAFWFLPYAQRRFGLSAGLAGAQLGGLMIGGGIFGCLFGGWVADHWRSTQIAGRVWTVLIAVLAEAVAILLALQGSDYRIFLLAFAVFCIASGAWTTVAAAIAFDVVPREYRGTGTAAYFLLTTVLGPGIGPFAVGLGSDVLGSVSTALASSCAIILIAVCALIRLSFLLERPPGAKAAAHDESSC